MFCQPFLSVLPVNFLKTKKFTGKKYIYKHLPIVKPAPILTINRFVEVSLFQKKN